MDYYMIRGPYCGRDKDGAFHCECGRCELICHDIMMANDHLQTLGSLTENEIMDIVSRGIKNTIRNAGRHPL